MAATAQSNPYEIFIRKIGYSVGLEYSLSRIRDLANLYARQGDVSVAAWHDLVHKPRPEGWNLDSEHIGDFFKSLGLVLCQKAGVSILPGLDALGLSRRELSDETEFETALRFIFASLIVIADGDIFLNFLAGEFQRDQVEPLLRSMILSKRRAIKKVVKVSQLLERAFKVISIEVQRGNTGGAAAKKSLSERNRTEALRPRTTPLSQPMDEGTVEISDDYFRKVSGRRRDWANSIGLCEESGRLTTTGQRFLASFRAMGISTEDGAFSYWPFSFHLEQVAMSDEVLDCPKLNLWKHLLAIRIGLDLDGPGNAQGGGVVESVEKMVHELYNVYRSLNPRREMLRKEMPLGVLYTASVAIVCARKQALPDFPAVLKGIIDIPNSPILLRASRSHEGTIYVKG